MTLNVECIVDVGVNRQSSDRAILTAKRQRAMVRVTTLALGLLSAETRVKRRSVHGADELHSDNRYSALKESD